MNNIFVRKSFPEKCKNHMNEKCSKSNKEYFLQNIGAELLRTVASLGPNVSDLSKDHLRQRCVIYYSDIR